MKVIDVHCHLVPADFPAAPSTCAPEKWPRMEDRTNGQRAMMVGKREMRVVDNRAWEAARRIADMNGEEIGMQAISPMPEILSYWIDAPSALTMARYMNRTIAEIVHAAPDRFVGLGMVPLQDPELAAKELATLRGDGLVGIEIGSNITGKSPGDPFFDPFYRRGGAPGPRDLRPCAPSDDDRPPRRPADGRALRGFPDRYRPRRRPRSSPAACWRNSPGCASG